MRKKRLHFGSCVIKIEGANLLKLVDSIQKSNYKIYQLEKINDTLLVIKIPTANLSGIIALIPSKCYTISIQNCSFVSQTTHFLFKNIGVLVGLTFGFSLIYLLNTFCWSIKINGDDLITSRIQDYLTSSGQGVGNSWNSLDFDVLEQNLLYNIEDLSLVTISRRGASLIINTSLTKNKTISPSNNLNGILATENGVVSRLHVVNGTPLVNVGDTVVIGQLLIAPYYLNNLGEQVGCEPQGKVYLKNWLSDTVEFTEKSQILVRTSQVHINYEVRFWNRVIAEKNSQPTFDNFEEERKIVSLSNVLPIKVEYCYFYELESVIEEKSLEQEKDSLIYQARDLVYQQLGNRQAIAEKHTITQVDDKYYISYYIEIEILGV